MTKIAKSVPLPHEKVSSKGGNKTLKKYGKKHFRALAQKRWANKKS